MSSTLIPGELVKTIFQIGATESVNTIAFSSDIWPVMKSLWWIYHDWLETTAKDVSSRWLNREPDRVNKTRNSLYQSVETCCIEVIAIMRSNRKHKKQEHSVVSPYECERVSTVEDLRTLDSEQIDQCFLPSLYREKDDNTLTTRCVVLAPGSASGPLIFSPSTEWQGTNPYKPILVKADSVLSDLGMGYLRDLGGLILLSGGHCSHISILARSIGIPCVVAPDLELNRNKVRVGEKWFGKGDTVSLDGLKGEIVWGKSEVISVNKYHQRLLLRRLEEAETQLTQANKVPLSVLANVNTPLETRTALQFGALGIGSCRIEHVFVTGGKLALLQQLLISRESDQYCTIFDRSKEYLCTSLSAMFQELHSNVDVFVVRLLDVSLCELFSNDREVIAKLRKLLDIPYRSTLETLTSLFRGCRLGIALPDVYEMQLEAIFEAIHRSKIGKAVKVFIIVPFVVLEEELIFARRLFLKTRESFASKSVSMADCVLGTMIETPQAALIAAKLARWVDCFIFGTNDLIQYTYAYDRNNLFSIHETYKLLGIVENGNFSVNGGEGVAQLIRIALENGRSANPSLIAGVCGELASDPASIRHFARLGMDFVSCVPNKVPLTRLMVLRSSIDK